MKIALVSDWFVPRIGGLEHQMRDLARELVARGHHVEIITATPGAAKVEGIAVHRLDVGPLLRRCFASGQSFPKLQPADSLVTAAQAFCFRRWLLDPVERLLDERGFDLVHAHSASSPLALAACRAARRADVPSVLTEHSVLKGVSGLLLDAAQLLWGWNKWPDVIAAVSSHVAHEMRLHTGREIEILPNGVSPEEWATIDQPRPLRVVCVMRLMPRKRGIDFVRGIPRVLAQLPPRLRPRFTLVGDGPERQRIEREAERLGICEHLELTGWLDRGTVRQVLGRSTVFVLPTIKEALSIATLEALSSGLPIVAMNHGGVGDIMTHGREGFLANTHDEFCSYIVRLLVDQKLRRRMAAVTRRAAARFCWDRVVERHLETYALARARRSGVPFAAAEPAQLAAAE